MKKIISLVCVMSIMFSFTTPTVAAYDPGGENGIYVSASDVQNLLAEVSRIEAMTDAELHEYIMLTFDISSAEAWDVVNIRYLDVPVPALHLPSNPRLGQWHYETVRLDVVETSSTANLVATLMTLCSGLMPFGVALLLINYAFSTTAHREKVTAIYYHLSFLYDITNDGVPGWIIGPYTCDLVCSD